MKNNTIYLDYAANTPVNKEVLDAFNGATINYFANPNSTHELGKIANSRIEEASNHLAAYIGKPVAASWQALYEAAEEWNEEHPDTDWFINVKQFEIIDNDELWDITR